MACSARQRLQSLPDACQFLSADLLAGAPASTADALRATRYTLFDEASGSLVTFAGREPWKV